MQCGRGVAAAASRLSFLQRFCAPHEAEAASEVHVHGAAADGGREGRRGH